MALTPEQITDFTNLTIKKFRKYKWTDISLEHPEYIASELIDEKKVVEQGGGQISFTLQTRNLGTARNTGLFDEDVTNVEDVTVQATSTWAKQTVNWSYDEDLDVFQSDDVTIVKWLKLQEHAALNSLAELNEENLWTSPTGTSDKRPFGIPYWVVKDATTTVGGALNGGNPSGHSAGCAGVSSSTYSRWKNWTFGYTNVTTDDMVVKVKKSLVFCNFMPPVPHPELGIGKSDYTMFTTYRVIEPAERLAESRNDNLGKDLARYQGQVTIGGVPLRMVHYLEANDTSDPIYGINWKHFRPYVQKGREMRRTPPIRRDRQHNVYTVHIDNWCNFLCDNRRAQFVGSKS